MNQVPRRAGKKGFYGDQGTAFDHLPGGAFPDILKRMVGILERLGVQGEFPKVQICCGQPFFNGGYRSQARDLAVIWLKVK
jgi:hypothetical protein